VTAWQAFFSWPSGGVWGNLLASLLWAPAAFGVHHAAMRRHHTRVTAQQTEELKAHIDAALGDRSRL
jgi:hypothetical protein